MSDNELGSFLRARREAVTPAEVGLPHSPRRRTPGLRRSELATLADVSVEYLTRLEQGRDRRPSAQVLHTLAGALGLSSEEHVYLHRLVKAADGAVCAAAAPPPEPAVRPTVRRLLRGMEPAPAVLINRLCDVLDRTEGYARLAAPAGLLDTDRPNLARFVFTDPRARDLYPEWDRIADERAAALRSESVSADPHVAGLLEELTAAGSEFSGRMSAPPALPRRNGTESWRHPWAGELRLAYETLELPDTEGLRILVYLPADDSAADALGRLAGRAPGTLRAVAD